MINGIAFSRAIKYFYCINGVFADSYFLREIFNLSGSINKKTKNRNCPLKYRTGVHYRSGKNSISFFNHHSLRKHISQEVKTEKKHFSDI